GGFGRGLGHGASGFGHVASHAAGGLGHVARAAAPAARTAGKVAEVAAEIAEPVAEALIAGAVEQAPLPASATPLPPDETSDLCLDCPDVGNCASCPAP